MIVIDGSRGEGGGQVLRTSLALSMMTGQPFRIEKIRAGRSKPGLRRQHLTSVNAALEISQAGANGNRIGSMELEFYPGTVRPGNYRFSVGTAGSSTLVGQTVLPALMVVSTPSTLTLEGGTHNPFAPPYDFLKRVYVPVIHNMGPKIDLEIESYGFFPAGGGKIQMRVLPASSLSQIELMERGKILSKKGEAFYSKLSGDIAERELKVIRQKMPMDKNQTKLFPVTPSPGPGNMVAVTIESEHITEMFTAFGRRGVPAEQVAGDACKQAHAYLDAGVPVGVHLADQLLLPMALAGGGRFKTLKPDPHTTTNIRVIQEFLDVRFEVKQETESRWEIIVKH